MADKRKGKLASDPARPLSIRERKVIRFKAAGYSNAVAMRKAGYKSSGSHTHQVINRPVVQSALTAALAKQGITLSKIVKPIGEALKATLHSSFMGELRASTLPDHKTRLEASELGISLYGGLPKQVELPQSPQEPLTVIVESPDGSRVGLRIGGKPPAPTVPTHKERQADDLKIVLEGVPSP